ncbi:hypothetical protein IG631_17826 [Alternaria alternata]|nr:hypothetical protein IG631_17826 [Alternaria alternata]
MSQVTLVQRYLPRYTDLTKPYNRTRAAFCTLLVCCATGETIRQIIVVQNFAALPTEIFRQERPRHDALRTASTSCTTPMPRLR